MGNISSIGSTSSINPSSKVFKKQEISGIKDFNKTLDAQNPSINNKDSPIDVYSKIKSDDAKTRRIGSIVENHNHLVNKYNSLSNGVSNIKDGGLISHRDLNPVLSKAKENYHLSNDYNSKNKITKNKYNHNLSEGLMEGIKGYVSATAKNLSDSKAYLAENNGNLTMADGLKLQKNLAQLGVNINIMSASLSKVSETFKTVFNVQI